MLAEDRLHRIVEMVNERGTITVPELSAVLNISESTIRRDLAQLDHAGRLVKVHGGAASLNSSIQNTSYIAEDQAMEEKRSLNADAKVKLATWAAAQIQADDFVFIDAGTTTQAIVDALAHEALQATYVTNSVPTALALAARGCKTLVLGGEIKSITEAIVGPATIEALNSYNFTKGFFGTNGVSQKQGYSTPESNEAMIKRLAMQHCLDCFVLADASKIDRVSPVTFAAFDEAILVTTAPLKSTYSSCPNVVEV